MGWASVCQQLALRDILRVRNDEVAFGGEADINGRAGLGGSVANDPFATLARAQGNTLDADFSPFKLVGSADKMLSLDLGRRT
jgi:hypothetical protein